MKKESLGRQPGGVPNRKSAIYSCWLSQLVLNLQFGIHVPITTCNGQHFLETSLWTGLRGQVSFRLQRLYYAPLVNCGLLRKAEKIVPCDSAENYTALISLGAVVLIESEQVFQGIPAP